MGLLPSLLFIFITVSIFLCLFWLDNLLIDYQFTFSLLQEDDRYYTAINFMATPEQVMKNMMPAHCPVTFGPQTQ